MLFEEKKNREPTASLRAHSTATAQGTRVTLRKHMKFHKSNSSNNA
jgi:hypothetical protein